MTNECLGKAGVNEYNYSGKVRKIDYSKHNICGKCSSYFEKAYRWCSFCGCLLRRCPKQNRRFHYEQRKIRDER